MPGTDFASIVRHHEAIYTAVAAHDSEGAVAATDLVVPNFERNVRRALKSDEQRLS